MKKVEPIRDRKTVHDISDYLRGKNERDYILWMIGIYTGLRVSDILSLRVRDVRNADYVYVKEIKTGKDKRFAINPELKKAIRHYVKDMEDYQPLILSPRGNNKAITRQQAYNILREAAGRFGVTHVGTHTMRKTFGYHMYHYFGKDAALLMDIFNHSDIHITLRYIGVDQDNKDKKMINFSYGK